MSELSTVYNASADLGVLESKVHLVVGIIISILVMIGGIYMFNVNQGNFTDGEGTVTHANCTETHMGNNIIFDCVLDINYNTNGQQYAGVIRTNSATKYGVGSTVGISYNTNDPSKVSMKKINDKYVSYILSIIALAIIGCAYAQYYMATENKTYAAISGASDAIGLLKAL